jgi:hypothetical protein
MRCSICDNKSRQQLVYCTMCNAWHCASHFNSALISSPGRLLRSPMVVDGYVDAHGPVVEAMYKGTRYRLSLEGPQERQVVKFDSQTIGLIELSTDIGSPWKAYTPASDLVGQRETAAGAVGCVVRAFAC